MTMPAGYANREAEAIARYSVRVVSQATVEPVSLAEVRAHLRLATSGSPPSHPDDFWLTSIAMPAARQWCENYAGRAFASQTVEVAANGFPGGSNVQWFDDPGLPLPLLPVQFVESITYTDTDGTTQTVDPASYTVTDSFGVFAAPGTSWPLAIGGRGMVRVRYRVGYTVEGESPNDNPIPSAVKCAILLLIAHWYENRETMIVGTTAQEFNYGVRSLLAPYVVSWGFA
jgi:uncharacterized phiE125 gp8 family phage protein